ncbi:MAG TPA: extracellular solute-binding protein [Methylomirabilota bacterium]|nr:extracellular solute-binding protein [Methylomirabilota bacterium]
MRQTAKVIFACLAAHFSFFMLASVAAHGATIAEVAAKIKSLKQQERLDYLVKGAQAEGELVYYGTLPIDEFLPLGRVFNGRYRSLALQHYFSPREGILNRTLTEARAGRHAVDVIQVDLSYGYQLLNENLVYPYQVPGRNRFYEGTYDLNGYWHSMYYLTTALIYNTNSIKPEQAPKSYEDLLSPAWKGKMLFDPEAAYLLAAMEQAWGREKALAYLAKLSKQDLSYRRGGTLTTQVVTSGEYPIGIAINGETSAAIRDKGAPLGFKVLPPTIVKPEGLFLAKNAPHPHAALLFVEWVLSDEAQSFLATTLGKGSAMKGARSKFKEFQLQPDFVVTPKLGAKLQEYMQDFRKIMNVS